MAFAHPEFLVSADWLAEHLTDDDVRVFETTVFLHRSDGGVRAESGRSEYETGHIPGSGFLDLQAEFSDNDQPFRFMMPSPMRSPRRQDGTASRRRRSWSSTTAWDRSGRPGFGGCSARWAAAARSCWMAAGVAGRRRTKSSLRTWQRTRPRPSSRIPTRRASLT